VADERLPLRPEDVSWEELRQNAEGSWRLEGPNSSGGTRLYRYRGQLFIVGYGDHSPAPGGAERVIATLPDNSPGFPPEMSDGHPAGCWHHRDGTAHSWTHGVHLLLLGERAAELFVDGRSQWSCPPAELARPDSPARAEVLRLMGPAVLADACRCADSSSER